MRNAGPTVAAVMAGVTLAFGAAVAGQQARYDDVIGNLRHPDAKVRLAAVRLLREAAYPEAIGPLAALVVDPDDDVQLEAIGAQLVFFVPEPIPARRRVGLVVERRYRSPAETAFNMGPHVALPQPVPPDLRANLIRTIGDENPRVRFEAVHALGVIARPPLSSADGAALVAELDHYDPAIRAAVARVIGRLEVREAAPALIDAMNDSQEPVRLAAMRALGEIGAVSAAHALKEHYDHYGRGRAAEAALEGLARLGHVPAVPLFRSLLADRNATLRRLAAEGLGRSGDSSAVPDLELKVTTDGERAVRVAMAFALQQLRGGYVDRMVVSFTEAAETRQIRDYLLELGPPIVPALPSYLQYPEARIRAGVVAVLGVIGGPEAARAIEPLVRDRDAAVARAAAIALKRLALRHDPQI
jgi:HEAT repeat protein